MLVQLFLCCIATLAFTRLAGLQGVLARAEADNRESTKEVECLELERVSSTHLGEGEDLVEVREEYRHEERECDNPCGTARAEAHNEHEGRYHLTDVDTVRDEAGEVLRFEESLNEGNHFRVLQFCNTMEEYEDTDSEAEDELCHVFGDV